MGVEIDIDKHNGDVTSDQVITFTAGQAINFDVYGGQAILYRRLVTTKDFLEVMPFEEGTYSDTVTCFCEMKFVFPATVSVTLAK